MMKPWFIKHAPQNFTELTFSTDVHIRLLKWLKTNKDSGILHLTGRPGIGKTILVKLVAKVFKYNLIEITENNILNLQEAIKYKNSILNQFSNLVLIDESVIYLIDNFIKKIKNNKVPIIITSVDLYFKNIFTLKIEKPKFDNINFILEKILKKEKISIDKRLIYKVSELCKYDIRLIINSIQVIHLLPKSHYVFNNIKSFFSGNFFYQCDLIFEKRLQFLELKTIYSTKLVSLTLNSILHTSNNFNSIYKILLKRSYINTLKNNYHFLELEEINLHGGKYIYVKDDYFSLSKVNFNKQKYLINNFLNIYSKNIENKECAIHIRDILNFYSFKNISEEYEKFLNLKENTWIKNKKIFRYKFNLGSTHALKKDISLKQLIN